MRFPRTSKTNNCPICGTYKSKCGWREDDINFRFCMSSRRGEAPSGWKYVGETKGGMWGMFVPNSQREYSEEERTAYKQRQAKQELKRRLAYAKSLSEAERDQQCNKLINQLPLHAHHREELKRRGLSDELINAGKFCSVDKFQKLDFEISYNLAGVDISGKSLTNKIFGYIVPIWNEFSQIIGYQIRNDDSSEDAPKYIWATSKRNKRRKKPATPHLQNGELPLTFCVPQGSLGNNSNLSKEHFQSAEPLQLKDSSFENCGSNKFLQKSINLSEGILKPWIMAQLRGLLVIGAAGNNFASSPEILKRYIEFAKQIVGDTEQVVLWADAGSIANRNVMREYRKVYHLLKNWGYTLRIAWWGQIDKNCKDGDEYLGEYELLTWGQFEGMSRHPNHFWDSVKKEINKINRCLRRTPKPIKSVNSSESTKNKNTLAYVPGLLPSYGEYVEMGCPTVTYKNSERMTIWAETVRKGWTHILDKSAPGLGKSHTAGSLNAEDLGINQLMYLASDHRNPTTITIEKNYYDVFPRHGGLSWDENRHTPSNRPFLIHPNGGDDGKKIPGNCSRHHIFTFTRDKNLNLESSKNIICQGCNLLHKCQTNIGDNYGYLSQRMNALKHPQIRLHPDSTPLRESYDYSEIGIFWDEASVLMRSKNRIDVRLDDLHQTIGYHATTNDFADFQSDSPLLKIYKLLLQLFELDSNELPRYGLDDKDIFSRLGAAPKEITSELIADLVESLSPDLEFLLEISDIIESKGSGKINRLLRDNHNKEVKDKLKSLPLNWLVPMLEVWVGYVPGYFSFNNGTFSIHQFDSRHRDVARAAAFNIYLDGTMPVENLSLKLGVSTEHILVLETKIPDYSNLEIVHINDMGVLGRDRRESQLVRLESMREALVQLELKKGFEEKDIGFIERKAFAWEGDGYHFRDSRGVNRFSEKKALISVGAPYPNIGNAIAEYSLLKKDKANRDRNKSFKNYLSLRGICNTPIEILALLLQSEYTEQDFIDGLVQAEILQEVGRLRSHLRLEEDLTYYFVGDYCLTSVISELPGVKYGAKQAIEISPMSAGKEERTKLMVMNAIGNLLSKGIINPKQKEVVWELEAYSPVQVKQERISQLAQEFGGWRQIVKLIENVLKGCDGKPSRESFEDEEWIVNTYLPLISENHEDEPVTAIKNLVEIASVYGWNKFREFIHQTRYSYQQKIVELILYIYSLLDISLFDDFIESG